jgi:4-amino-4-deoxy-L-arabinose transferase-like glycosyltransferase
MPRGPRRSTLLTFFLCSALGVVFAWTSYSAVLTKSATLDEPIHTASAYTATYLGDYRLDLENPPLWKYWAMLTVRRGSLHLDPADPTWRQATGLIPSLTWARDAVYHTPTNDGIALVNAARGAMVLLALVLFAVAVTSAYRLAGSAAAIATAILLAFDPTFLAHAAIVKNDVAVSLLMLLLVIALTRAMIRLTPLDVLAVALVCAAAVNVKMSGILFPLIALAVLCVPAWTSPRRARAFGMVAITALVIAATCYITIWASYRFRYSVAPDPSIVCDMRAIVDDIAARDLTARLGRTPTQDELARWRPPAMMRIGLLLDRHHVLPQAWCAGLVRSERAFVAHENYLLGQMRERGGWWYYFPLAMLVKTPLATIAAVMGAVLLLAIPRLRRRLDFGDEKLRRAATAASIASAIYLAAAMTSNANYGVRHVLPIYPLIFIAAAVVFARTTKTWPRATVWTGPIIAILLMIESLAAYPNYIAFFNAAAGGSRGGFYLLGDSNLDWGQDLPLIAQWRRAQPNETFYLLYYGTADPDSYGIGYINRPGGGIELGPRSAPSPPGVVAVSATRLQGLYMPPQVKKFYEDMRTWPVREVLGGTIYLFDYPPAKWKEQPPPLPTPTPGATR